MKKTEPELIGVKEIARRANVSIGTVDRVIHNRKGVSEKTKQKILSIIEELQFKPNVMASLLASKKNLKFATLIPGVSNETDYWNYPLNGIKQAEAEVKQFGVNIAYFFFDLNSKDSFISAVNKLIESRPNAVLLAPSFVEESIALVKKLEGMDIPVVFINSDIPNQKILTYIGPDLFQSGRLAAQLIGLAIGDKDKILVVNISTVLEYDHHLLRKEQGFKKYFEDNKRKNKIITHNISETRNEAVEVSIKGILAEHSDTKAIFVTNSRVNLIANILKKNKLSGITLVGYDFLDENLNYLGEEFIDFLICQRPKEQGYLGIISLYKHLFNISEIEKAIYMPIDIITKENYKFYNSY